MEVVKKLISIGVDTGSRHGAGAIIDANLNILEVIKFPFVEVKTKTRQNKPKLNKSTGKYEKDFKKRAWLDTTKFRGIFEKYINNDIVYSVEKVFVKPSESNYSSFIFGTAYGAFCGVQAYLNPVRYYEVTPTTWKQDLRLISEGKIGSIKLANEIFEEQLKKKKIVLKSVTSHADISEALLIAFWGLNNYLSK